MESKAAADIPECGECGKPWTTDLGRHQRAVHRGLRECICDSCREEQPDSRTHIDASTLRLCFDFPL